MLLVGKNLIIGASYSNLHGLVVDQHLYDANQWCLTVLN